MKRLLTLLIVSVCTNLSFGQNWTTIASDPVNDHNVPSYLDGTLLEYWYDQPNDSLWFRVTVASMPASLQATFGVNIMVNYTGGGNEFNFWGLDNMTLYNRLVSAWVNGSPPSNYSGTIGVADASGVIAGNYTNLSSNNLTIVSVNAPAPDLPYILIGMKRSDLIPASALNQPIATAAAVGTDQFWNDDIYSPSGTMTISTSSVGIEENISNVSIYPNPATSQINIRSMNSNFHIQEVHIIDVAGRLVLSSTSEIIDVNALEPGVYFLKALGKDQKEVAISKFVKE